MQASPWCDLSALKRRNEWRKAAPSGCAADTVLNSHFCSSVCIQQGSRSCHVPSCSCRGVLSLSDVLWLCWTLGPLQSILLPAAFVQFPSLPEDNCCSKFVMQTSLGWSGRIADCILKQAQSTWLSAVTGLHGSAKQACWQSLDYVKSQCGVPGTQEPLPA